MPTSSFKQSFRLYLRLLAYLKPYRGRVFLDGLCMILFAASTGFVMRQLTPIVNETFLKTDNPDGTFGHLSGLYHSRHFFRRLTPGRSAVMARIT